MSNQNTKHESGLKYFLLGLCAFLGLGLEAITAFFIEPIIYGLPMEQWATQQHVFHWILTCVIWGVVALVLVWQAKKRYGFRIITDRRDKTSFLPLRWCAIIISILFCAVASYLNWEGFKVSIEFERLGILQFVFQYLYYLFETILFSLIIIFAQKAGELWFKKTVIPWGGIFVALTWGLLHIFSQGNLLVGILAAISGLLYGVVYILTGKNIKVAFLLIFVMFII